MWYCLGVNKQSLSRQEKTHNKVKILLYFGLENRHSRGIIKPSLIFFRKLSIRKLPVIAVNFLGLNDDKHMTYLIFFTTTTHVFLSLLASR